MEKQRRKFTAEDRLSLLKEAEREGQSNTCRKYNIAPSLFLRWKKKYLEKGVDGLRSAYHRVDPAVRMLEEENERLKRIVAKQALEIEFKTELLKHAPIDHLKKEVGEIADQSFPVAGAGLEPTTFGL
jgi:transposase-like protein